MNYLRLLLLLAAAGAAHADARTMSSPYTIIARYRVNNIRHLSGIAILGRQEHAAETTATAAIISDKERAVFRLNIPLTAHQPKRDSSLFAVRAYQLDGAGDCEDITYDETARTLYIACEQRIGGPSRLFVLPVDKPKKVRSYALDSIFNDYNTGAEGCAVVPYNGRRELWVGKERFSPPIRIPPIYRYIISDSGLSYCGSLHLDVSLHRTQSGMTYDGHHNRLWIISRELHFMFAVNPQSLRHGLIDADTLSFGYGWDEEYGYPPPFGMAEGIAVDKKGYLYVAFDNNEEPIGRAGYKKKKDPLLLVLKPR